ncbi:MAG TPA: hypothetical protein VGE74_31790 [Gemmata sp.]
MTVYIQRDGSGKVTGVFGRPQPGTAEEAMDGDAPEVAAFRTGPSADDLLNLTRTAALATLNTRSDLTAFQVRAIVVTVQFLVNNRLEFLFEKVAGLLGGTRADLEAEWGAPARVLDTEIFAYLQAHPSAGDPVPGG